MWYQNIWSNGKDYPMLKQLGKQKISFSGVMPFLFCNFYFEQELKVPMGEIISWNF